MKTRVTLIAVLLALALVQPAAARPRDPDGRRPRPNRPPVCQPTFGDPLPWRCGPRSPGLQAIASRTTDARHLLRAAADAVARSQMLAFTLDMHTTTTNVHGGSWTAHSTLTGHYEAPDRLHGVLTITNPWSETQSQVIIADGEAYVSNPQTEEWATGLKLATSYFPVIFTGCLIRMAEADTDSLVLIGVEKLDGESVFHLKGPGGSRDELEIEYWLGVEDGLPRQALVRTPARPGWSDEVHTLRITATLRLSGYGEAVDAITPPVALAGVGP